MEVRKNRSWTRRKAGGVLSKEVAPFSARVEAEPSPKAGRCLRLAEALLFLMVARLVLRWLPFRQLTRLLSRPVPKELLGQARRQARREVRRALLVLWRRGPLPSTCFHRGIAAQLMLRRRGVASVLYYGAATLPGRGLTGHVWVRDGAAWVVGRAGARNLQVLGRYPADL